DKGTEGLKSLIYVRRYQDYEFVNNIINYPKYWNSIRENSLNVHKEAEQIEEYVKKLKELYPELNPVTIYFSIGAFRSGGTYLDDKILLGGEFLFAQQSSSIEELPERVQKSIKEYAPNDI